MPEYSYTRQAQALESTDDVSGSYDAEETKAAHDGAGTAVAQGVPVQEATKAWTPPDEENNQYDMAGDPFAESRRGERSAKGGYR